MDIVAERIVSGDIVAIENKLRFKDEKIVVAGSASLASQQYPSDIDLFSKIDKPISAPKIYNEIRHILKKTGSDRRFYPIEIKAQNINGSKTKWNRDKDFTRTAFLRSINNLDFIKLDYVINDNNIFKEVSIIYFFKEATSPNEDIKKELEDEIAEYKRDGNLFKAMKRQFSVYNIEDNKEAMVKLSKLFNSHIGKLYQKNANLKAIKLLLERHNDEDTRKRVAINLKDIGEQPYSSSGLDAMIKANDAEIQKQTLLFKPT